MIRHLLTLPKMAKLFFTSNMAEMAFGLQDDVSPIPPNDHL